MSDLLRELQALLSKFEYEKQQVTDKYRIDVQNIDEKINAIHKVMNYLKHEGFLDQAELFEGTVKLSTKYTNMSKSEAVLDILNSDKEKEWQVKEILNLLQLHGFKTKSKNLMRDLYSHLYFMARRNKIKSVKTENGLRYKAIVTEEKQETNVHNTV